MAQPPMLFVKFTNPTMPGPHYRKVSWIGAAMEMTARALGSSRNPVTVTIGEEARFESWIHELRRNHRVDGLILVPQAEIDLEALLMGGK